MIRATKKGPPITLPAALRDAGHDDPRVRDKALRHLADALLAELGPGPRWRAAERHPRGADALATLRRAAEEDPSPVLQGFAAIGLGQLGDLHSLPVLRAMLTEETEGEEASFRRECGAIALAELASAARDGAPALLPAIAAPLREGLAAPQPELRFQCAGALVDAIGDDAEAPLAEVLIAETNPEVRRALCEALARIDRPAPATVDALRAVSEAADADPEARFAAALGLTAARDPGGAGILIATLRDPERRDRALEALAALGEAAPAEALPPIRALASAWLTPRITRVRAAYALARLAPAEGLALLDRFGKSRSASVREAVADARAALEALARGG
ncbi:MAG: HEAT repeat domain-containing protein [Myxococcales bacterium]|nr:HEAT repeat domain-containing protein [Myxococcales bacterium]